MKTFSSLELDVLRWAEARKIIPNSNSAAQARKTLEEAGELVEAATVLNFMRHTAEHFGTEYSQDEWDTARKAYKDAVGDIIVTLINGVALEDVSLVSCLELAYNEIKDRKGYLREDGVYVKQD